MPLPSAVRALVLHSEFVDGDWTGTSLAAGWLAARSNLATSSPPSAAWPMDVSEASAVFDRGAFIVILFTPFPSLRLQRPTASIRIRSWREVLQRVGPK